jgi:serine/threonine-protein kinase mTOR
MNQMAPDYELLMLLQKVEVFEYALENTTGQDLYKVLWLKSSNSEHWLERRATYTRSLAVNSMVGHILGLGDRHPSNLLLERSTGKVVHIDFGDCFEVAMHRDKFPEKVPFRLTRMLTHAMEVSEIQTIWWHIDSFSRQVSGIEGSFRNTCEITMQVLRDNKESLMAVLEAFVYDPLINWRLMQADVEVRRPEGMSSPPSFMFEDMLMQIQADERAPELTRVSAHPQAPSRKLKADENEIFQRKPRALRRHEVILTISAEDEDQEIRNDRALFVYNRVQNKLTGKKWPFFRSCFDLMVGSQAATSIHNKLLR